MRESSEPFANGVEISAPLAVPVLKSAAEEWHEDLYRENLNAALVARRAKAGNRLYRIIASWPGYESAGYLAYLLELPEGDRSDAVAAFSQGSVDVCFFNRFAFFAGSENLQDDFIPGDACFDNQRPGQ